MTLQTIIKQRYGTALEWETEPGLSYVPEAGEVCWYAIPVPPVTNEAGETIKTFPDEILFRVGDGTRPFKDLPFGQAKAADVYAWAKQDESDFLAWLNKQVSLQNMIDSRIENYLYNNEFIIDATGIGEPNQNKNTT